MKRRLLFTFCIFLTLSLNAQSDALWMSIGLGGAKAKYGLFRADLTLSYLRYNRLGAYLDLQGNSRPYEGIEENGLKTYNGFSGGLILNLDPYGDADQKVLVRAGLTYGNGIYVDSVKFNPSFSQSGVPVQSPEWFGREFSSIGLELSAEGLVVINHPNRAWGFRLITVINRHPFIGGCIRLSIGSF